MSELSHKIPEREFSYEYMSSEWMTAYFKYKEAYKKPDALNARGKALSNELPCDQRIYQLTNAYKLAKEGFESLVMRMTETLILDSNEPNTKHDKELQILINNAEKAKQNLNNHKRELGAIVAESLLNGVNIGKDMPKVQKMLEKKTWSDPFELPRPKVADIEKITLKTRVLVALEVLQKQWFPNGEAFQMITKAALQKAAIGDQLKRRAEGTETGGSENLKKEFRNALKELGLSNLPQRSRS